METRPLGSTEIQIAPLGLGTRNFGRVTRKREALSILDRALDAGINFIDTAPRYQAGESEKILGKALSRQGRRERVILATKVLVPPETRSLAAFIAKSCEGSLKRLRTDRLDLFQLHRPVSGVPQEEVLAALAELVKSGKVRYLGCSTHPAPLLEQALAIAEREDLPAYVSEQPPYSLVDRSIETDVLPLCREHGLAVIAWSPLAGGILAGRYATDAPAPKDSRATETQHFRHWLTPEALALADSVRQMATARGMTPGQLALLWVKDQPAVTCALIGPRKVEHLEESLAIAGRHLSETDRERLDELVPPGSTIVDFRTAGG